MRIRNRFILFLFMPIVVALWFFGSILYFIGSRKHTAKSVRRKRQKDLTFDVITSEQQFAKPLALAQN